MPSSKARGELKKHGSFKLASAQGALQQPASTVGQAPEVQSRQQDDQAVVRASGGERDRVKSYMSEAWTGEVLTRTRRQQCMKLSSNTANTMAVSDDANKTATVLNNPHQFKILEYVLSRNKSTQDITRVHDVTDEKPFHNVKGLMGEIDKYVSDGVNKLLIADIYDMTWQEELPADEANERADSLNLKLRDECHE